MNNFANLIEANAKVLTLIESTDQGKPLDKAGLDVMLSIMLFRYYAGACERIEGKHVPRDQENNFVVTRMEPVGVCGLITPWNFPLLMTSLKMAPMLAAGCTGVFKPPELAPLSSLKLAELWHQVKGVPPGVVNMVPGLGHEAGQAIVDHPGIAKIAFTGSTATGKKIMRDASGSLKRLNLELGGKNPLIICDDADFNAALETAFRYGFTN
jgi:acyl-CoA reductase-like NAD-dependent aldehyde dehydrogenase